MDFQVNLYAIASRHPDYATRAWAWGELRRCWATHDFPRGNRDVGAGFMLRKNLMNFDHLPEN